jgi:hypothetical protein
MRALVVDQGRVVIARNVFLDMPSYFSGKPIRSFGDLVGSNPLISTFMFTEQYVEFVGRVFDLASVESFRERFSQLVPPADRAPVPNVVDTRTLIVDCVAAPRAIRPPRPILFPETSLNRLCALGVDVVLIAGA